MASNDDDGRRLKATVDWRDRTISFDGDTAYDVRFCEGDAPFLCVTDDGAFLGSIELAELPEAVDDFDTWAADFYSAVEADRLVGCDPGYTLDGDEPKVATVAGALGVRYGFVGRASGRTVERVRGYAINDAGSLRLLVANALADEGCMHRESELPVEAMDDLEPVLAAIAAGSRF